MHGLSLVILTLILFGGLAFFLTRSVPISCRCADATTVQGTRGGLERLKERCAALCQPHGGLPAGR
jgi:hypothetical protein